MYIYLYICIHSLPLFANGFRFHPPKLDLKSFRGNRSIGALYVIFTLANAVHTINKYMMVNSFMRLQLFTEYTLSPAF